MNRISLLIIDDEKLARIDLKNQLKKVPNINILGEAENIEQAAILCEKTKPDLIFLDIQLGKQNGFDLLNLIDKNIKIVFVTAYDEYAVKAFEVNAMDYLLKPVLPERLLASVQRVMKNERRNTETIKKLNYNDKIFLKINNRYMFLKLSEILAICAADYYTEIILKNGKKNLVSKSLKEWESTLPQNHFLRIHRSFMININEIKNLESINKNSFRLHIRGLSQSFPISRRYLSIIKSKF